MSLFVTYIANPVEAPAGAAAGAAAGGAAAGASGCFRLLPAAAMGTGEAKRAGGLHTLKRGTADGQRADGWRTSPNSP